MKRITSKLENSVTLISDYPTRIRTRAKPGSRKKSTRSAVMLLLEYNVGDDKWQALNVDLVGVLVINKSERKKLFFYIFNIFF